MTDKSFLVGASENQADILFWWIKQCKHFHPDIPIQIADFGLSEKTLNHLLNFQIIKLDDVASKRTPVWFNKADALICSNTDVTLWMDIDTEFIKNVYDIFDMAQDGKIGLVKDQFYVRQCKPQYNTGVILMKGKPNIIPFWFSQNKYGNQRGDQEELLELLKNKPELNDYVFELPSKYNYVRLEYMHYSSRETDLRVVHWTGPTGKQVIRNKKIGKDINTIGTEYLSHDYRPDNKGN